MANILWKIRKLSTTIVYGFEFIISAIELSISYATSWLYLKEVTKDTHDVALYYGILHIVKLLPPLLLINIISHYSDKYGRIKIFMIIANYITLAGCVIYLIPGSAFYVIVGRFFVGFNQVTRPLLYGETARTHTKEEYIKIMLVFRGVFTFAKAAGPLLVIFFLNTNFNIGPINIRYSNVSAAILFCLVSLLQVAICVFVHDISRETQYENQYDDNEKTDKSNLSDEKIEKEVVNEFDEDHILQDDESLINNTNVRKSPYDLLLHVIYDFDLLFIMFSAFCEGLQTQLVVLSVPVIILERLEYSKQTVNIVMAVQLFFFLVFLAVFYFMKARADASGIIGCVANVVALCLILCMSKQLPYRLNVVLAICTLTLQEVSTLKLRVFMSASLASMVDAKYQSFLDGFRLQMIFLGSMAGGVLAGIAVRYLAQVVHFSLALSILVLILTLVKRKVFKDPRTRIL